MTASRDIVCLVRHAKAGRRSEWTGDDRMRPLTDGGRRQAQLLGERLSDELRTDGVAGTAVLRSSPYLRCVQTLEPLAQLLGTSVTPDERLAEDTGYDGAIGLLVGHDAVAPGAALCSHGDVIPATIEALVRRGCEIVGAPDWRKGSVWVLERHDGTVRRATCWPPPEC